MEAFFAQTGSVAWRTPPKIIVAARETLGGVIQIDPCASSDPKNHYAKENWVLGERDGYTETWAGKNALINHPFGTSFVRGAECLSSTQMKELKEQVEARIVPTDTLVGWRKQTSLGWAAKAEAEHQNGSNICWISKMTGCGKAGQILLKAGVSMWIPKGRIAYTDPVTDEPCAGANFESWVLYRGNSPDKFKAAFSKLGGVVYVPDSPESHYVCQACDPCPWSEAQ